MEFSTFGVNWGGIMNWKLMLSDMYLCIYTCMYIFTSFFYPMCSSIIYGVFLIINHSIIPYKGNIFLKFSETWIQMSLNFLFHGTKIHRMFDYIKIIRNLHVYNRIHFEQSVNTVSDNIIIINCAIWPKENCAVPNKKLFGPMVCHMSLSKTLNKMVVITNVNYW